MKTKYKNKILFGDAFEVLKQLPGGIVQTCVTSPPYWGLRDYRHEGQLGLEATPEEYIERLTAIFCEVNRVLKDDGTLWLNLGDSYISARGRKSSIAQTISRRKRGEPTKGNRPDLQGHDIYKDKDLAMIPAMAAIAFRTSGWYLRSDIIWHKPNPMPESVKDRPTKSHEHIFLLSKNKKYYYDWEAIGTKHKLERRIAKERGNGLGKMRTKDLGNERDWNKLNRKNKRDVWSVNTKPYTEAHFAVFPPKLIEPCIKAGSKKSDLVLDPFIGSGTTAEVALKLGRNYLGIDLQEDYEAIQNKRLEPLKNDLFVSKTL